MNNYPTSLPDSYDLEFDIQDSFCRQCSKSSQMWSVSDVQGYYYVRELLMLMVTRSDQGHSRSVRWTEGWMR